MRRKSSIKVVLIFVLVILFLGGAGSLLYFFLLPTDEEKALGVVKEFYYFEQQANSSSAWELFHPELQDRFSRDHYIIDRTELIVNQFGTDTFTYSLSEPEKIENWKMTADSQPITVFKIIATLSLIGKYGHFDYIQYTYVTEVDEEWKILWDFNT